MNIILLATLCLSEVLANEPGSTVSLEWIELAANSSTSTAGATLSVNADTIILPTIALDSGAFLVLCRDLTRFEQHYGDSSGVWGDAAVEKYALAEAAFELTNSSGHLELQTSSSFDTFTYTQSAPDGVSFERIGDTTWQFTAIAVGSTPGARNDGLAWPHDWAIMQARCDPPKPAVGEHVTIQAIAANVGSSDCSSVLYLLDTDSLLIDSASLTGNPSVLDTVRFDFVAEEGYNLLRLILAGDDRLANNALRIVFYVSAPFLYITEIYAIPEAGEPEWLELFMAADTTITPHELLLADMSDTTSLSDVVQEWTARSYTVVTSDAAGFLTHYSGFEGVVIELPDWPTLNNDGDSLSILYAGAIVEQVGYPTFGNRRGVSYERVGTSETWGFCADGTGATPGARNSIDVPYSQDVSISITPNPFAPGHGEQALISFVTPFAAAGELRLYAGDGRYLRTLIPQAPLVSGSLYWDGRDKEGRLAPIGMYLLQLRLTKPSEQNRLAVVVIAR